MRRNTLVRLLPSVTLIAALAAGVSVLAVDEVNRADSDWHATPPPQEHAAPHAPILAKEFITEAVRKRVPADSKFFRDHLEQTGDGLTINIQFPPAEQIRTSGFASPLVELSGTTDWRTADGQHAERFVGKRWVTFTERYKPKISANVEFILTVSYNMNDGEGALILPCSVDVLMQDDRTYSWRNAKVDLDKMSIVTRPKQAGDLK